MHFELTADNAEFSRLIMEALAKEANKHLKKLPKKLTIPFRKSVEEVFRESHTYQQLINGELRGRFGFPNGTEAGFVGSILFAIRDDLHIDFTPVYSTSVDLYGGITIYVVKKTLEDILKANGAEFVVRSPSRKIYPNLTKDEPDRFNIKWVDWLLLQGDKIIVQDFSFVGGEGIGRSTKGVMRPTTNSSKWFRVPPDYSGTINDNWVTRTLDHHISLFADKWGSLIEQELTL